MSLAVPYVKPIVVSVSQPLMAEEAGLVGAAGPIPPSVSAGGSYSGVVGTAIALNGTVTPGDDPAPVILWSIASGGTGTFSSTSDPDATFTPDSTGTYTLLLSADPTTGAAVVDSTTLLSNASAGSFFLLTEAGDKMILEDSSGFILSEAA